VTFLRLNPLAFTFTWAEILSQALEDMERGEYKTEPCARLRCHTTDKMAVWRRLLRTYRGNPENITWESNIFRDFVREHDETSVVESILARWRGSAEAQPVPAAPLFSHAGNLYAAAYPHN